MLIFPNIPNTSQIQTTTYTNTKMSTCPIGNNLYNSNQPGRLFPPSFSLLLAYRRGAVSGQTQTEETRLRDGQVVVWVLGGLGRGQGELEGHGEVGGRGR